MYHENAKIDDVQTHQALLSYPIFLKKSAEIKIVPFRNKFDSIKVGKDDLIKTMQLHRNKNAPSEISSTHCTRPAPVSSFKWWRNGIFGQIRCSYYVYEYFKYFEDEQKCLLKWKLWMYWKIWFLSFLKCNFYNFLKDCTYKKHFDVDWLVVFTYPAKR